MSQKNDTHDKNTCNSKTQNTHAYKTTNEHIIKKGDIDELIFPEENFYVSER